MIFYKKKYTSKRSILRLVGRIIDPSDPYFLRVRRIRLFLHLQLEPLPSCFRDSVLSMVRDILQFKLNTQATIK